MSSANNSGVSIIICCYNSALRLPETIKHIGQQIVSSSVPWELIIVNNCSSDNTEEVVKNECKKWKLNSIINIINQPIPGLSAARELGIETAKYKYILFCDDDNWLEKTYIQNAYEIINENPAIGALGGYGSPHCQSLAPVWFSKIMEAYSVGRQNETDGDITKKKGFVFGAGMVIRRTAYDYLIVHGFKSLLSDRKGNALTAGGDVELCYALTMAGFKIWYSEKLKFIHFIPTERLTNQYLKKLYIGIGQTQVYLDQYLDILKIDKTTAITNYSWMAILLKQFRKLIMEAILYILKRKNIWYKLSCFYYWGYIKTLIIENLNLQRSKTEIFELKKRFQTGKE